MSSRRWIGLVGDRPRGSLIAGLAFVIAIVNLVSAATPADAAGPAARTGRLVGPVDVQGGSHPRIVARLPLDAGNWTVFATGVLRNTTLDATAHPALCRLSLGGSSDQILASPARRDRGGSRQSLLLLHAAHLESAGHATLRCAAPGSAIGDIVIEDIRIAALRTAALGVTRELGAEIFYGNADATSQVRLLKGNDALVPFGVRTVATSSLPAGAWSVTAKATVLHASDAMGELRCWLSVSVGDASVADVAATDTPGDRIPIALDGLHSASGASDARLQCQDLSDGGTTGIRDIRIAAYRATAIDSRELDPDARFDATPAWVKPVVYVGHETEYRTVPVADGFRTLNRLSLPPGDWVAVATGILTHAAAGRADVACRVGRGSFDEVSLRLGPADTVGQGQPFVLSWAGTFTERDMVRFQCRSTGTDVGLYYLSFTVYKVGSLGTLSLR